MNQVDYNAHRLRMQAAFDMITSGCYVIIHNNGKYRESSKYVGGRMFQFTRLGCEDIATYSRGRSLAKDAITFMQRLCVADDGGYYIRRLAADIAPAKPASNIENNKHFMDIVCEQAPEDSTIEYYSGSWHY